MQWLVGGRFFSAVLYALDKEYLRETVRVTRHARVGVYSARVRKVVYHPFRGGWFLLLDKPIQARTSEKATRLVSLTNRRLTFYSQDWRKKE